MRFLSAFLGFPDTGLVHQGPAVRLAKSKNLRHSFCRQIGRIRAHVGYVPSLIKSLSQLHGLFGGELEGVGSGLLQARCGEGRGRGRMAFGFHAIFHSKSRQGRNTVSQSSIQQIFLASLQPGLGKPNGTPASGKRQFRAVVGHGHKALDSSFALYHQPHSRALHPPSRETCASGTGKRPTDQIPAKAVKNAPGFLCRHQCHVQRAWGFQCRLYG